VSIESAKAFIERMKTDEDFANKAMQCKDADARMAFASAAGYGFTPDDMNILHGEMTDSELDVVTGGGEASTSVLGLLTPIPTSIYNFIKTFF
jgi:predicted ribosomally synthesized peptide with nif11-like leader